MELKNIEKLEGNYIVYTETGDKYLVMINRKHRKLYIERTEKVN